MPPRVSNLGVRPACQTQVCSPGVQPGCPFWMSRHQPCAVPLICAILNDKHTHDKTCFAGVAKKSALEIHR